MPFTRQEIVLLKLGQAPTSVYKRYYRSSHWLTMRQQKLALNPVCEAGCGRRARQCHHKGYGTFFNENPAKDLWALCGFCHRGIHRG